MSSLFHLKNWNSCEIKGEDDSILKSEEDDDNEEEIGGEEEKQREKRICSKIFKNRHRMSISAEPIVLNSKKTLPPFK